MTDNLSEAKDLKKSAEMVKGTSTIILVLSVRNSALFKNPFINLYWTKSLRRYRRIFKSFNTWLKLSKAHKNHSWFGILLTDKFIKVFSFVVWLHLRSIEIDDNGEVHDCLQTSED